MLRALTFLAVVALGFAGWVDMWKFPWTGSPLELMLGVSCQSEGNCFVIGGQGNTATGVYYTTNDFKNVTRAQMDKTDLLGISIAMSPSGNRGVAGGAGTLKLPGIVYSNNAGKEWKGAADEWLMAGQDIENIAGSENGFAYVGSINALANQNGVLISEDGGLLWEARAFSSEIVSQLPGGANCTARYGSFPSKDTFYVTCGSWPQQPSPPPPPPPQNGAETVNHWLTSKYGFQYTRSGDGTAHRTGVLRRELVAPTAAPAANQTNGYCGAILKTTDGGKTYTIQYSTADAFYFNDIDCADENTCMATGEGFAGDGSTDPGARVMCTTDGGSTWTQCLKVDSDPGDGSMYIRMVSATEAWTTVNQEDSQTKMAALFYHTTDGGRTWTLEDTIKGVGAVMDIDMVSSTLGYATGLTDASVMTIIKYTA